MCNLVLCGGGSECQVPAVSPNLGVGGDPGDPANPGISECDSALVEMDGGMCCPPGFTASLANNSYCNAPDTKNCQAQDISGFVPGHCAAGICVPFSSECNNGDIEPPELCDINPVTFETEGCGADQLCCGNCTSCRGPICPPGTVDTTGLGDSCGSIKCYTSCSEAIVRTCPNCNNCNGQAGGPPITDEQCDTICSGPGKDYDSCIRDCIENYTCDAACECDPAQSGACHDYDGDGVYHADSSPICLDGTCSIRMGGGVSASPSTPATPSTGTAPATPGTPTTGTNPATPGTPTTGTNPATPSTPSSGTNPATPSTPASSTANSSNPTSNNSSVCGFCAVAYCVCGCNTTTCACNPLDSCPAGSSISSVSANSSQSNRTSVGNNSSSSSSRSGISSSSRSSLLSFSSSFSSSSYYCGDGTVNNGEQCEEDSDCRSSYFCNNSCLCEYSADCGNGITDAISGEQCDDGNGDANDDCVYCRNPFCGDGVVHAGVEDCEPDLRCDTFLCVYGGAGNTSSCSCSALGERCGGNGTCVLDPADPACNIDCTTKIPFEGCGDGIVQPPEECDDGNTLNHDGCFMCLDEEWCGDTIIQSPEECDDGNEVEGDGCYTCLLESCGDATVQPSEGCDDGNRDDGDGCDGLCIVEVCGNNVVQINEECDDGNTRNGDGCTGTSENEQCGDGYYDYDGPDETDATADDEQCDDGNTVDSDTCTNSCIIAYCGDGVVRTSNDYPIGPNLPPEECDEGTLCVGGTSDGGPCVHRYDRIVCATGGGVCTRQESDICGLNCKTKVRSSSSSSSQSSSSSSSSSVFLR